MATALCLHDNQVLHRTVLIMMKEDVSLEHRNVLGQVGIFSTGRAKRSIFIVKVKYDAHANVGT